MAFTDLVFEISRSSLHLWLHLWHRYKVVGAENVPTGGGCLIASNHTSFLDPAAVSCGTRKRRAWFLARNTLWGGHSFFFKSFHCIPVNRDRGEVAALRKSIEAIQSGEVIALFPEGTRSVDGTLQPAKGGIGFIVSKAKMPVIPAYVDGAFEAYPKGARWIRPRQITITYGPAITPDEIASLGSGREAYDAISRLIMERIALLRDERRRIKNGGAE